MGIPAGREYIAMSFGYWGRGKTPELAMKQLKKAGGTIARKKMIMSSVPSGTKVYDDGGFGWKKQEGCDEPLPPYYVDRKGERLKDQAEPLI